MSLKFFFLAFAVPFLVVVIYFDYRWRRIPNFVTFPLIVIGFVIQMIIYGGIGFQHSLTGFFIGSSFFFIIYLLGGMGAGDVKLMGGIGALLGTEKIFTALILIIFIGGLMAIIKILIKVISIKSQDNLTFTNLFRRQRQLYNNQKNICSESETIPYGIAISIGTLITIVLY